MNKFLSDLIFPLTHNDFLTHYKANRPFVVHHNPNELRILRDLPHLKSLSDLLKMWPSKINAHLPDVRDEASSIDVSPQDAMKLFENGMGLLFNDVNDYSTILQEWVQGLRMDLGLSSLTYGRSLIYATPDGKGTAPHFDQNMNFVLQIHGTKKWAMARNDTVLNPTVRHTMGRPADPELQSYLEEEMPLEMPEETESFELKPGSLLFVPRGVWHRTEAEGHALSLNFTFTAPTWADLFLSALRGRLLQSPEWRGTADGLLEMDERLEAEKKLNYLLKSLVQDLPYWQAEDIIEGTEG